MKKIYFVSLLAVIFLGLSCAPKNSDVEEATLTLSKNELTFESTGATKTVTITTNQTQWSAISPKEGEWVKLAQNGNNLDVTVTPNSMGKSRGTIVVVNAGGIQKKVAITQSAAGINLSAAPNKIVFSSKGGQKTIDINSNVEEWSVEFDQKVDWLSLKERHKAGEIIITAQPNTSSEPRQVKLIAKSGSKIIEVAVLQNGHQKFALPLFEDFDRIEKLVKNENERGNIIAFYHDPEDFFGNHYPGTIIMVTDSKVQPRLLYTFDTNWNNTRIYVKNASLYCYDYKKTSSAEYTKFMEDNGFKIISQSKNNIAFMNEKLKFRANMSVDEKTGSVITFKRVVKQPKDYPTFNEFPYNPPLMFLHKTDKKAKDVKDYELNVMKSEFLTEVPDKQFKDEISALGYITQKPEHCVARLWFFNTSSNKRVPIELKGSVAEVLACFDEPHMGVWESNGDWIPTKEFEALLKKEGFVFNRMAKKDFVYYRASDQLVIFVGYASFSDVQGGKPVLKLNYVKRKLTPNAKMRYLQNPNLDYRQLMKEEYFEVKDINNTTSHLSN